jgi:hypothetical protein
VQTAPQWIVLALAARGSRLMKWATLPCAAVWLFLMALIWLFVLGWAHVISGTFSPIEIAMTVVVGTCSIVIIAHAHGCEAPRAWHHLRECCCCPWCYSLWRCA